MTRYIKQRDTFRCGPVAVLNSIRWAGLGVATDFVYDLSEFMGCTRPGGTPAAPFEETLRDMGRALQLYKVSTMYKPKLYQIEDHLEKDGSVILNVSSDRTFNRRHYMNVIGTTGKKFTVVNAYQGNSAVHDVSREKFKKHFVNHWLPQYKGWFLTRI